MPRHGRFIAAGAGFVTLVTLLTGAPAVSPRLNAQTDLDAFMKDVVARRDDNWKKLQQYILDEREELALTGPGGGRLWGEQRDFTWFIRDGFFVRSPVKVDGATVGEADRRKAEDQYLRRTQRRDARGRQSAPENAPPDSTGVGAIARPDNNDNNGSADAPTNIDGLIRQTRQPQFVSSSYFLRFKFDEGRYALAGREKFEGIDVLKVEYLPDEAVRQREPAPARQLGRQEPAPAAAGSGPPPPDEQGRARHAVDRAVDASDREVHLRQRRLRVPAGRLAGHDRHRQGVDDDEPAVSGGVAAQGHRPATPPSQSPSANSRSARTSAIATTASPPSRRR